MIIPLPDCSDEPEEVIGVKTPEWYEWFFNVPDWIHDRCRAVNFGRNKYCAYCYGKTGVKHERDSKEGNR